MSSAVHRLLYPMIAGLCCLACTSLCWTALDGASPRVLSLRELAGAGAVLMSCAEDTNRSDEPLWCADPDSPHCIPALPDAPSRDVWHGPVAALTPLATHPRTALGVLLAWPPIRSASLVPVKLAQRLERPPKHA